MNVQPKFGRVWTYHTGRVFRVYKIGRLTCTSPKDPQKMSFQEGQQSFAREGLSGSSDVGVR